MKFNGWLILSKAGAMNVRKSKPRLGANEIAVKLNMEVPKEYFERPTIEATILVSDPPKTEEEAMEVVVKTKDLIEKETGQKIIFEVISDEGIK